MNPTLFIVLLGSQIILVIGFNYTTQERNALYQLHQLVDNFLTLDYQKLDSFLIRWLRSTNFNVAVANENLQQSLKWRKENKIDGILNETLFKFNPPIYKIDSVDYDGRPIITFQPTAVDLRRIVVRGEGEKVTRYWAQILEEGERAIQVASNKSDGKIYQGISLMDLSGFNIRSHICIGCIPVFIDWIFTYERHHPDMAKHIVWINAPRIFLPVFEVIKPFFTPATQNALKLFTTDKKEWSKYLYKIAPPDALPVQFGGIKRAQNKVNIIEQRMYNSPLQETIEKPKEFKTIEKPEKLKATEEPRELNEDINQGLGSDEECLAL